ncbi:MAG: type II toxin-antitoxin system RelE/ParE family toxin [Elusimicrobia bacterium]|nr:type II toxin-antitoxin system RelE/ParE family toxin [Elusimicrobiota bacterium]
MSVRWTQKALADLDSIHQAIAENRPRTAERVIRALLSSGENLRRHPRQGRPGRLPQTRELVAPRLPYVIVSALNASLVDIEPEVTVLRVIHGAMRWPSEDPPK